MKKLVTEFEYLRHGAMQPLRQFLDFISYEYMIDNVMLVLKATYANPNVKLAALLDQINPLGKFKESTLKSIIALESSLSGFKELFQTVLIDTPIGKYFQGLSIDADLSMIKVENIVRKLYLEDFYLFCKGMGGATGSTMEVLLKAKADAMAVNITLNSFGTVLNDANARERDRKLLYPSIGNLYPEGIDKLSVVGDENELYNVLRPYPEYKLILEKHQQGEKYVDDGLYEREVMLNEIAFEGQFNYSCFYSYIRLKEQEIRNLVWICECVIQKQKARIDDHFVSLFSKDAEYRRK